MPGPACYGRGGTEPTVTDANLFLGRMQPDYFLGGRMRLDVDAARRALGPVAEQVGLEDTAFAEGVLAIVNANMADAMRTITVKQGIDPRDFALVAFGGAGPMHAAWLARELDIGEVIVPWSPGMFSAWGMLQTDMRHDVVRTFYEPLAGLDASAVETAFAELEAEGGELLEQEGVAADERYFARTADMRYVGQEYFVSVTIPAGAVDLAAVDASFHDAHRTRYGHSTAGAPVEFVNLRLAAFGRISAGTPPFRAPADGAAAQVGSAPATFDGEAHDTALYRREALAPGTVIEGPAVIGEQGSTTVVPPGYRAMMDDDGNLVLRSDG
jgi:N-methylhydantoinase A